MKLRTKLIIEALMFLIMLIIGCVFLFKYAFTDIISAVIMVVIIIGLDNLFWEVIETAARYILERMGIPTDDE